MLYSNNKAAKNAAVCYVIPNEILIKETENFKLAWKKNLNMKILISCRDK